METAASGGGDGVICAHGPCTCPVEKTYEFCGPTCRMGIGEPGEPCKCGHGQCSATTGEA
jgi:hypothetical protein